MSRSIIASAMVLSAKVPYHILTVAVPRLRLTSFASAVHPRLRTSPSRLQAAAFKPEVVQDQQIRFFKSPISFS
jgi:hypothetical protein